MVLYLDVECKGSVCILCVEERGRGFSLKCAPFSVSQHFPFIQSLFLPFLPLFSSFPLLSVLCYVFLCFLSRVKHTHSSHSSLPRWISHLPGLHYLFSIFSRFPDQSLGFWLSHLYHSYCILHLLPAWAHCGRNQKQTEVGVLRASLLGLEWFCLLLPYFALLVRLRMLMHLCS